MSAVLQRLSRSEYLAVFLSVIIVLCTATAAIVVTVSNSQRVEAWKIQPTVLLALLSSIFNGSLSVLLTIGVTICWWRTALHGTTVAPLQYIWERGMGLNCISALSAGFSVSKVVGVTAIVAIATFINNPLLQRATGIQTHNLVTHEEMKLDLVERLPDGWLGRQWQDSPKAFISGSKVLAATQKWWGNDTITTLNQTGYYCDGICEGSVKGAGMSHSCTSVVKSVNLSTADDGVPIFTINSTLANSPTGIPLVLMAISYVSAINDSCIADVVVENCNLEAAVVKYPLIFQNSTVALNRIKLPDMEVVSTYISPGDSPTTSIGTGVGPMKGLDRFINGNFLSKSVKYFDPSRNTTFYDGPGLADFFYQTDNSSYSNHTRQRCRLRYASPKEYLLNSINHYLFLAALDAGNQTKATEIFEVTRTRQGLVFRSDYRYLAGTLSLMLFSLISVLFLLWGWWELGRPVSLSPLETAKAFRAPLMLAFGRNDADGILDEIGHKKVIYDGDDIFET